MNKVYRVFVEKRNDFAVEAKEIFESLKSQLEEAKEAQNDAVVTEPLRRLEEKVITNATLKPDMEYGARVIGKIFLRRSSSSIETTRFATFESSVVRTPKPGPISKTVSSFVIFA